VEKILDANLGVFILRAPKECLERANLNADAAIHAQGKIDIEAVKGVDLTRLSTFSARRSEGLMRLDVDAPIWTLSSAQHARGAVLFFE
jgi:hypothetical protein